MNSKNLPIVCFGFTCSPNIQAQVDICTVSELSRLDSEPLANTKTFFLAG